MVKESDNTAPFPHYSTGRFFCSSFTVGAIYDVYGTESPGTSSNTCSGFTSAPYGSYTRYTISHPPPHPPPIITPKKRLIKKSVVLGSLSAHEPGVSSRNKIHHAAVTQITVTLDPSLGQCCVGGGSQKVKDQVGFDVILLDSKCYPLLTNEDTSSEDFWKSTRKIIAAPKQAYEKLGGVSADTDWFKECDQEEYKPPQKKYRCKGKGKRKMEENVEEKLDEVMKKLDRID